MKCPHCLDNFHDSWDERHLVRQAFRSADWFAASTVCPACGKAIVKLWNDVDLRTRIVYPAVSARKPVPPEIDDATLIEDYTEACRVLVDSPKASAALSRRCLQYVLKEKAKVASKDLADQIEEVINSGRLPSELESQLNYVRVVGNFATHPIKSQSSEVVVPVEPGEAEWNLDVIEDLMDYYYVRPAVALKKKEAINKKLKDAGKPELP